MRVGTYPAHSWISSIQTVLLFSGSIFAGRYFDSHGPRLLAITGTLLSFGSLIGVAFCKTYWQFFLAHAAFGASGSCLYSPGGAVAGHWFLRKRSTAVGIVVTGSGLAGVIYPIALHKLLDQLKFRDAILIIAGMNAALMIPSSFLIKARLPPRTPPPLKSLLGPWSEPRYVCLVLGVFFLMMKWVSSWILSQRHRLTCHLLALCRHISTHRSMPVQTPSRNTSSTTRLPFCKLAARLAV